MELGLDVFMVLQGLPLAARRVAWLSNPLEAGDCAMIVYFSLPGEDFEPRLCDLNVSFVTSSSLGELLSDGALSERL